MPSHDYDNPTDRSERRIKNALSTRAADYEDRGIVSRAYHGAMQGLGRSSTQNFLKRQRNIAKHPPVPSAHISEQKRATANAYISHFEQAQARAKELGNRGGAGDARTATNWEAGASTARGVQNAATAAEVAELAIATTGVGTVPAAVAAIPTEAVRQGAKASANYLQSNATASYETAQENSEAAARATTSRTEERYHNSSGAVYNNRRLQSAQRVDGATARERSDLRTQRKNLSRDRGDALTDVVEEPMRNKAASTIARNYRTVLSNRRLDKLQNSVAGAQEKAIRDKAYLEAADRGQQKRAQAIVQQYQQSVGPQPRISRIREFFGRKSTYTQLKESASAVMAATNGEAATNALHSMGRTASSHKPSLIGRIFNRKRQTATRNLSENSKI